MADHLANAAKELSAARQEAGIGPLESRILRVLSDLILATELHRHRIHTPGGDGLPQRWTWEAEPLESQSQEAESPAPPASKTSSAPTTGRAEKHWPLRGVSPGFRQRLSALTGQIWASSRSIGFTEQEWTEMWHDSLIPELMRALPTPSTEIITVGDRGPAGHEVELRPRLSGGHVAVVNAPLGVFGKERLFHPVTPTPTPAARPESSPEAGREWGRCEMHLCHMASRCKFSPCKEALG